MENLAYSLNATAPVFLVIILGYILRQIGVLDDHFTSVCNKFNFKITLPVMLYMQMTENNVKEHFSGGFVLLCAVITTVSIAFCWLFARLTLKDHHMVGAFAQSSFRGSVAVLGMALVTNIYGSASVVPAMMVGSVTLYNVFAVLILTLEGPKDVQENWKASMVKSVKSIVTNPLILAILIGLFVSWFQIQLPVVLERSLGYVSDLGMPQALICIGAGFQGAEAIKKIRPTLASTFIKLVLLPGLALPVCAFLGIRGEYLAAILVMQGSPSTSTGYVMVKSMGGDDVLASGTVVATTALSAFTLTFWVFLARQLGLL